MQKVNTQFVFATNNILKKFVELFYQIGIFVLYKFLYCNLQARVKAIIKAILEKTQIRQFFILYNNINFCKNICDQKIFNHNGLINYII